MLWSQIGIRLPPQPFLVITTKNSQRIPLPIFIIARSLLSSNLPLPLYAIYGTATMPFIWFQSTCQPRAGILSLTPTPWSLKVTSAPLRNCLCYTTPLSTHDISLGKPPKVMKTQPITMLLPKRIALQQSSQQV